MVSTNAASSAFGWDFQSNAAIMLMLKNIERATKIKIEGQTEDIEITFKDGKMLMSQAKSVFNLDDTSNVRNKMIKALHTLNNAAKLPEVEQLVFVTNSPNPFNDTTTIYKFSSPINMIPFIELPSNCQQVINDIRLSKGLNFNTSQLTICVMQFFGENLDERYKVLKSLVSDFLKDNEAYEVSTNNLLLFWQHSFSVNATQKSFTISKKQMIWPVIAMLCDGLNSSELDDYDKSDKVEILQKYQDVINNNSERFECITRILTDYNGFHSEMNSNDRTKKFVEECWENYKGWFDIRSAECKIVEIVIRLTLIRILANRRIISKIKGNVKL